MSKSAEAEKMEILKVIKGQKIVEFNEMLGRNIPYEKFDDIILRKPDYYELNRNGKKKEEQTSNCVEAKLTEKLCKIPQYYTLSNLPVLSEKRSMQDYHFTYTDEQLKNMYKTPKIIVDMFCSSFNSNLGTMYRISFFAVAPNAQSNIPSIYRFSIVINESTPEHYSISLHGIVGGKEDGWLFLGRLDNAKDSHLIDDESLKEKFSPKQLREYNKKLKMHNAVKKPIFTASEQEARNARGVSRKEPLQYKDCIPCPHMHKPNTKYKLGDDIERCLPKFMRNCFYNDFDENVMYMMNIFNIYKHPHFRKHDALLVDIIKKERKITTLNKEIEADKVVDELFQRIESEKIIKEVRASKKHPKSKLHKKMEETNFFPLAEMIDNININSKEVRKETKNKKKTGNKQKPANVGKGGINGKPKNGKKNVYIQEKTNKEITKGNRMHFYI